MQPRLVIRFAVMVIVVCSALRGSNNRLQLNQDHEVVDIQAHQMLMRTSGPPMRARGVAVSVAFAFAPVPHSCLSHGGRERFPCSCASWSRGGRGAMRSSTERS